MTGSLLPRDDEVDGKTLLQFDSKILVTVLQDVTMRILICSRVLTAAFHGCFDLKSNIQVFLIMSSLDISWIRLPMQRKFLHF